MAKLTKGYAYAYQALGYLCWKRYSDSGKADPNALLPEYEHLLEEFVYEKIWYELSDKERDIISVLQGDEPVKIAAIREALSLSSGAFSVYRDRLSKKGLVDTSKYGYLSLRLPRFGQVISMWV